MKPSNLWFVVSCSLYILSNITPIYAQHWRSLLYPVDWHPPVEKEFYQDKFLQDYSYAGYHRGEMNVPVITSGIIDVTKEPYKADHTGHEDVTDKIQEAINDAIDNGGGVVYLPAGTYKVSRSPEKDACLLISDSRVILRGDGPDRTFLYNDTNEMRGNAIIKVLGGGSWATVRGKVTSISQDLMKPTNVIPVESADGFELGETVIIHAVINDAWIADHHMETHWKEGDIGGMMYCREIDAIDIINHQLFIDIPIRYALKRDYESKVYPVTKMISEVGIEELSIGNRESGKSGYLPNDYQVEGKGAYDCHDSFAITMERVKNSWIRNVHSYRPEGNGRGSHLLSNGIKVDMTKNVSILHCIMEKPLYGGGGGNGYMFRIMGNETLLEDCEADQSRHGFVFSHATSSGNVIHRCIDKNTGRQKGGFQIAGSGGSDHHMHFCHSNLIDQSEVKDSYFDVRWRPFGTIVHGITGAHSCFWNITSNGFIQSYAVWSDQARYGYVIGTSGNKSKVKLDPGTSFSAPIMAPIDHVEGVGEGEQLLPTSLYMDQKARRLQTDVPVPLPEITVNIEIKVHLEGFWNQEKEHMHAQLVEKMLLPVTQPFYQSPFFYEGSESLEEFLEHPISEEIIDWMLVELRDPTDTTRTIARKAAILLSNGRLVDDPDSNFVSFGGVLEGEYWIALYHKSHLAVMSKVLISLSKEIPQTYDFTVSENRALGINQLKKVDNTYVMFSGDYDQNGIINNRDYNYWKTTEVSLNIYHSADSDGNGVINNQDFSAWYKNNYKLGIPELRK